MQFQTKPTTELPERHHRGILGVRFRVLLLILVMQALMIWWISDSEITRGIYLICYALMMPTALYLLLVRLFRRVLPFDDGELMLGYIVLTATIPIIGFGGMRFIAEGMGYLRYFSQFQPDWARYLAHLAHLPVLSDPAAIQELYSGGDGIPWRAWAGPIVFWSAYLLLLSAIWICLAGILRRIWINQERLTFPMTVLPLRMADPRDDIFRRSLFWIGFAVPAILQSLLVLHDWYPTVPAFQLKAFNAVPLMFTSRPWNAIPDFQIGFYPMAIGLAYFLPGDISFSCWFFSILMRLTYVAGAAFGIEGVGGGVSRFPYRPEQAAGAWIAFAFLVIWGARHHWRTVAQSVPVEERRLVGVFCAAAGVATLLCAGMMSMVGIPPIAALGVILIYLAYVLSGARMRAEAGGMWTFAPDLWTANRLMNPLAGAGGDQALVASGHFDLIHVDIRAQSLPYLMEGLNIAEHYGIRWRTVLVWVAIGSVTALGLGWWRTLAELYDVGAATAKANPYPIIKARIAFEDMNRVATGVKPPDSSGTIAMLIAGVLTLFLAWIRRFGVVGLHPVGYVACNTYTMNAFIVPFFIAWGAKTLVLRLGGQKMYRDSVPLFVGVVLGDVVAQAVWALVGWIFNVPIYQFLT